MNITTLAGKTILDGRPVPAVSLHGAGLRILGELLIARAEGRPMPSYHDLIAITGLSPNGITHHLKRLRQLGLTEWEPGLARTLRAKCRVERIAP